MEAIEKPNEPKSNQTCWPPAKSCKTYPYTFTVFTPTYNRAYTLELVLQSLMQQSAKQRNGRPLFEWLIIDDGSTDNTKEIVKTFKANADFSIRYYYQANRGKHIAINRGASLARGEFFIIADSDDAFVPEALDTFHRHWQNLTDGQKRVCAGIACLAKDGYTGEVIGNQKEPIVPVFEYELPYNIRHRRYFEMWGILRTDILRKYHFPEIADEENTQLVPEGFVWNTICRKYKRLITNDALRIVYHREDGFSKNQLKSYIIHARGRYHYHLMNLIQHRDLYLRYDFIRFIKEVIQLGRMSIHSRVDPMKTVTQLKDCFPLALLWLCCLPVAMILANHDHRKTGL
jgi:glycosyltransferase involved in cell wall biosynthesis